MNGREKTGLVILIFSIGIMIQPDIDQAHYLVALFLSSIGSGLFFWDDNINKKKGKLQ